MTSPAQQAYDDIGFDDIDRHNAMRKLKYLETHDPEMLRLIVERCESSPDEAKLWRSWLSIVSPDYSADESNADHLMSYRMRYELFPTALQIAQRLGLKDYVIEVMVGSSWQFGERTGSEWDLMRAHMLAVTVAPYFGDNYKESMNRVKFVADHFDEVMEKLPDLAAKGGLTLSELTALVGVEETDAEEED